MTPGPDTPAADTPRHRDHRPAGRHPDRTTRDVGRSDPDGRRRTRRHRWAVLCPPAATPAPAVLVRDGQLLAVLDLHPARGAGLTPESLTGALDPLATTGGIVVAEIVWWRAADGLPPRRTVVIGLDPVANHHAIQARGGGNSGAARLVAVTAARAAALLAPDGPRPRLLDPDAAWRLLTSGRCQPVGSVTTSVARRTALVNAVRSRSAAGSG